jgi:2,5-diamino-6-(ribosylamino)-4(3H)-pyrimidinone 5'-phosphate reductase
MLSSVDGKISTGDVDSRDIDSDFPRIKGVREGLRQYYALERKTDLWSMNTGRVMAKIGINVKKDMPTKTPLRFVIVDNKPHLKLSGINYLSKKLHTLYIITNNKNHPGINAKLRNVKVLYYKQLNFSRILQDVAKYGCKKLTIQSGGTLNATLLRHNLIDRLSLVIAPALIGGKKTPTLIDGESLRTKGDLKKIKALRLKNIKKLKHSYIRLVYDVVNIH